MDDETDLITAIKETPFYESSESANEVPSAPNQETDETSESEPENNVEEVDNTTAPEEGTTEQKPEEDATPDEDPEFDVSVDGKSEKIKLSELKNSYMRQADYTRKTQEIAETRRSLEQKRAEQDAAYTRLSEVLKNSADKLEELEATAPSVKLRAELNAIDVASLTPEQLQEYQRVDAICNQMARKEAEEKAAYKKVREDALKEFEARDKARMQAEFTALKSEIPEMATSEGSVKLGQELTEYMNTVYGADRAKVILSNIRTKEDFLTAYYAMKGYKLSKTNVVADAQEKAKAFKTGQQANSQAIKPQKSVRSEILNRVHSHGDRSEISDEDLIQYLSSN